MECIKCKAINSEGQKYCGNCGASMDSNLIPPTDLLGANLSQQIRDALKDQFRDQKVVEIETTQAIATRLSGWAKLLGFFVGIPVALLLVVLGYLGFNTYSDFSNAVKTAKKDTFQRLQEAQKHAKETQQLAKEALKQTQEIITQAQEEAEKMQQDGSRLKAEYEKLHTQLGSLTRVAKDVINLTEKVERIDKKVHLLFEPSEDLSPELQSTLESSFSTLKSYLRKLGFPTEGGQIKIKVGTDFMQDNAYYEEAENRIVLGKNMVDDVEVLLRVYVHNILATSAKKLLGKTIIENPVYRAVEIGLADYFTCSFTGDPLLGEISARKNGRQSIRNLKNNRRFSEVSVATSPTYIWDVCEIWGGVFWNIRQELGKDDADKLIYTTWSGLKSTKALGNFGESFAKALLETANSSMNREQVLKIQTVFKLHLLSFREEIVTAKRSEGKVVYREVKADLMIPDNDPVGLMSSTTVEKAGMVEGISVNVDITHTYLGDLRIILVAPWGDEFVLQDRTGGMTDNLIAIYGTDTIPTMRGLINKDGVGTWTLVITDSAQLDIGKLNKWSLEVIYN